MKILHIIDSLEFGGAQTVVRGIIESQKDNKEIYLFVLRDSDKKIQINHANINIFPSIKRYCFKPLKELMNLIINEKIEILHCHLFRSQIFGWILKKRYFHKSILVFHEHGRICSKNFLYTLFLKYTSSRTDIYLAVSKAVKNNLMKKASIPDIKIKVLYNFVDLKQYNLNNRQDTQKTKSKLGIRKEDFIVGFAGRLITRKGWRTLVSAAEISVDKLSEIKFLIAGDGDDKMSLMHLIDCKGLKNRVFYLGYISDMVKFYSLLDCFVIPSYWEPMGLTEIEAQAMGVPVIASNVESLNEIIKDAYNGLMFEAKNEQDLAEKIYLLFDNNALRHRIVKNGLDTVKDYSLDNYIKNLNNIYHELI